MTERSSHGGERRTPAAQENLAAKKERHGKSDAVAGFIMALIGLPLFMFVAPSILAMIFSGRGFSRLCQWGFFKVLASAGFALGILGAFAGPCTYCYQPGEREFARRRACLNNLKQTMTAILTYAPDYGGSYPTHTPPDKDGTTSYRDLGILYPTYLTSLEVVSCPSSGDQMPKRTNHGYDNKPFPPEEAKHLSYAYGLNKNAKNKAWTQSAPRTTRVLADRPAVRPLTKRSNHKTDGRNVAFADGHVKWVSGGASLDSDPDNPDPNAHGTGPAWWSER
jgi:prepilin-type processing-associated H-X9-DG protein